MPTPLRYGVLRKIVGLIETSRINPAEAASSLLQQASLFSPVIHHRALPANYRTHLTQKTILPPRTQSAQSGFPGKSLRSPRPLR